MRGNLSADQENLLKEALRRFKLRVEKLVPLRGDGSWRRFVRVQAKEKSFLIILPQEGKIGLKEAYAYYNIGNFLQNNGIPTPTIFDFLPDQGVLLIEDLGNIRLFDCKTKERHYPKALRMLRQFQSLNNHFNPEWCYDSAEYDFNFLWSREVLYFREWYLEKYKRKKFPEDLWEGLQAALKNRLSFYPTCLIHRDFQSKNLMLKGGKLVMIDFQGTRLGPPWYDVASLLYDPYVEIPQKETQELLTFYVKISRIDQRNALEQFRLFAIVRLMQALAAFVKLSHLGKPWFREYVTIAEKRLEGTLKDLAPEEPVFLELHRLLS